MRKKKGTLKSIALVISLTAILQLLGCSFPRQTNSQSSTIKPLNIAEENFVKEWKIKFDKTAVELERNRNLWEQNQTADYDFVVSKSAGGNTNEWNRLPVLVKIRDGEKISIEKVEKDKDYLIYSRMDGVENFDTVNKLFNYLQQELEKGKMLEVKYHKDLGYPKSVIIIDSYETHGYRNIVVEKIEVIKNI
jgi:hypothetical protein